MSAATESMASILNGLIQTCKDGQEGFRNAAADVENRELKELFTELSVQREQFALELENLASGLSDVTERMGSLTGFLHRSWIDLKAAMMNGNELAILAECERGEDFAVSEYRDAMEHRELPPHIRSAIRKQSLDIQAAHDRVRDLHERFATGGAG